MRDPAKTAAKQFWKKYRLTRADSKTLQDALKQQGYTVVEFNRLCNEDAVQTLIDALGLEQYIASSKGFTYASQDFRLVFLHGDLTEEEKAIVLAHEQGHIFCGHVSKQSILGEDVQQEHEANEFAHCLLHPPLSLRLRSFVRCHKKLTIALLSALTALLLAYGLFSFVSRERSYYGEYYLTETGAKYHTADCGYVRGKDSIRRMTKEDYATGNYSPCEKCIPTE